MTVSITDQIKEVAREIAMRRNVYPGFVAKGRMTQEEADMRRANMQAVVETLNEVKRVRERTPQVEEWLKPPITGTPAEFFCAAQFLVGLLDAPTGTLEENIRALAHELKQAHGRGYEGI